MEKKQTAVQWLLSEISLTTILDKEDIKLFEQAEQMFKEQIKESHKAGIEFITSTKINGTEYSGKYFNETFKK